MRKWADHQAVVIRKTDSLSFVRQDIVNERRKFRWNAFPRNREVVEGRAGGIRKKGNWRLDPWQVGIRRRQEGASPRAR